MKGKKTGGRQKGTPNKENPLKGFIKSHSNSYFEPKPQTEPDGSPRTILLRDKNGDIIQKITLTGPDGLPAVMSDFDIDMLTLPPADRVNAEIRLLEFHTPKMKAVDIDMNMHATVRTIEDRLRELCGDTDPD